MAERGLLSGRLVAQKYQVGELLGRGGMGAVYEAQDIRLHRPVALKMMSPVPGANLQQLTQLFQAEALRLANLNHPGHPGLPDIYDYFEEAANWFLVMKFIEGETLKDYLERHSGRLPVDEVLKIGLQLADILHYLHTPLPNKPPMIFRDLKPANVMIALDGRIYLIDFGIARIFTPGKSQDTYLFLSPGYAAPEQHGAAQTTVRSDIYSLGATLHHLLSGTHPATSPFLFAPLSIQQPAEFASLIAQMVAIDAANRPASMATVKNVLQRLLATASPHALEQPATTLAEKSLPEGALPQESKGQKPEILPRISDENVIWSSICESLAWSPDGTHLAIREGGRNTVIVLDVQAKSTAFVCKPAVKSQLQSLPNPAYTTNVAWSPNGKYITSEQYGKVWVCDATTGQHVASCRASRVYAVAWSHDSKYVALGGENGFTILDALTCRPRYRHRRTGLFLHFDSSEDILSIVWAPDDRQIASGGTDKTVRVWNVDDVENVDGVENILTYSGHTDAIASLAWSPDGTRIASGSWDQTVHVWDTTGGKNMLTYSGHSAKVDTLAWSPNGTYLASGSRDQTIQIWKADTGSHVSTYYARSKRVTCVTWSPTGAHLASASYKGGEDAFDERADGAVQIWAAP